jgi:hypothetical protein
MKRLSADNYPARVEFAERCFREGVSNSRDLDSCFEMYDGDAVVVALVRKTRTDPQLRRGIAAQWSGEFPARWLETAHRYRTVPDKKLVKLATELRAAAAKGFHP